MNRKFLFLSAVIGLLTSSLLYAAPDRTQLQVWANEAIVATYTFDYKNFLQNQKDIAKYFSSDGWIAYSKALNDSKLPDVVQKNMYQVTAVATHPPVLIFLDPTHWQAMMPILVNYKNPQYEQQQNLKVVINFTVAPAGQGVRGFAITSLKSTVITPPCECKPTSATTPGVVTQ